MSFRHIIDLVDFFEGVSESVIVMEFAEGMISTSTIFVLRSLKFKFGSIYATGTDLFATLSAVHYELTESKCRVIIAQVINIQVIFHVLRNCGHII